MAESFSVGEVAIFCRPGSVNYGREVTIVRALKRMRLWVAAHDYYIADAHLVSGDLIAPVFDRYPWAAEPQFLRKKKPAPQREDTGEWESCPWRPSETVCEQR